MFQVKIEFVGAAAAKAFDLQVSKLLRIVSSRSGEVAFIMITSDNGSEQPSREISTDDPDLIALLTKITPY